MVACLDHQKASLQKKEALYLLTNGRIPLQQLRDHAARRRHSGQVRARQRRGVTGRLIWGDQIALVPRDT
jgi:hypothetical protein